jgi:hypothetical protein
MRKSTIPFVVLGAVLGSIFAAPVAGATLSVPGCHSDFWAYDESEGSGAGSSWCDDDATQIREHRVVLRCSGGAWSYGPWASTSRFSKTYCAGGQAATGVTVEMHSFIR